MSTLQLKSFISYWLNAVDEHSLHSPFYYDFYVRVIRPKNPTGSYAHIESLRQKLLHDKQSITVEDYGAGATLNNLSRRVCDIARTSLAPLKLSALYHRLIQYTNARTVIELGTSFGINTLYLAEVKTATIYTFEGASRIALIAKSLFDSGGTTNIQLIEGNIDKTLPSFLNRSLKPDVVIMDANHRYAPTMNYFHQLLPNLHSKSIVVIDDIHYSEEMKKAWNEIKKHKLVYGSTDLFRCGMAFFDPSLNKQNVVLQY